jgi:hypothetical protein
LKLSACGNRYACVSLFVCDHLPGPAAQTADALSGIWRALQAAAVEVRCVAGVARAAIDAVMAHPSDAGLVQLLSVLGDTLAGEGADFVFPHLVRIMETQAVLTEALLDDPSSSPLVQALLFERLAPLLVLRTLAPRAFASAPRLGSMPHLLLQRMCGLYEFDQVRRLAAEAMAKCPPLTRQSVAPLHPRRHPPNVQL